MIKKIMKRYVRIWFSVVFILCTASAQEFESPDTTWLNTFNFYPSITLTEGNPIGEFKNSLSRKALWGGTIDVVFRAFDNLPAWEPGGSLEFLSLGQRKDSWNGIEVTTSSALIRLNLMSRIRPLKEGMFNPFFEFTYGIDINSTSTSYEIVDRATFADKFFFGDQDKVENVDVHSFNDYSPNVGIGLGMVIDRLVTVQIQYNYCPTVDFIDAQNVTVVNDTVEYGRSTSSIEMFVVKIGVSLEKFFLPK